ncbi:MAG: glycosyltransferase family 2 protein [Pseudomonadota bacterium]
MLTCSIIATARNEGPFIIEWIAHHLGMGFDKILVATNDCDDFTAEILVALQPHFPVVHIENEVREKSITIQRQAVRKCLSHPENTNQDWCFHIDLDEFVNITAEHKDISSVMGEFCCADAVSVNWRVFGSDNRDIWDGGSVIDTFLSAQSSPSQPNVTKFAFRPNIFRDCAPHCPKAPQKEIDDLRVVTSAGDQLDATTCFQERGTVLSFPDELATWDRMWIAHYMHKSRDLTRHSSNFRGDANGRRNSKKRTVGSLRYIHYDLNEQYCYPDPELRQKRIQVQNEIFTLPKVRALHYRSLEWHFEKLVSNNKLPTNP